MPRRPRICRLRSPRASPKSPPRRGAVTAFRLEGVAPSVAHRKAVLEELARALRPPWRARRRRPRARSGARSATSRRSPPPGLPARAMSGAFRRRPSRGAEIGRALAERARGGDPLRLGRWPGLGGLAAFGRCRRGLVRSTVAAAGGHATLIRAPAAVRAAVDVFEPEAAGAGGVDQARARELRSARACSMPGGCGRAFNHADLFHPGATRRSGRGRIRKRSCAPACIAAFAPPPARPTCSTATSSIRRAAASTSSRTCWRTTGRRRPRSRCMSIAACRASPA